MALRWTAYVPTDAGRHPAVLVLHSGGFKSGDAGPDFVSKDLAAAGFFALSTEYRLAPPHTPMNTPDHPAPSQNTVVPVDHGNYPEQTDDVRMAIRAARQDPRCNGLVYGIGGSAGAAHVLYMSATGVTNDDKFDLAVMCSGVYDLANIPHLNFTCIPGQACFVEAVLNYVGATSADVNNHNYTPYLTQLRDASPSFYVTPSAVPNLPPMFFLASDN